MSARAIEPTFRHALRVWWAFTWRTYLWIILPPLFIFFLRPSGLLGKLASWAFMAFVVWVQIDSFRKILRMDFPSFKVRVLEPNG